MSCFFLNIFGRVGVLLKVGYMLVRFIYPNVLCTFVEALRKYFLL